MIWQCLSSGLASLPIYAALSGCWGDVKGLSFGYIYKLIQIPAPTRESVEVPACFASETLVGWTVLLYIHLITTWSSVLPVFCMGLEDFSMYQTTHMLTEEQVGESVECPCQHSEALRPQWENDSETPLGFDTATYVFNI